MLYDSDLAFVQASGFGEFAATAVEQILPMLRDRGVQRVIDIGCGAGVSTRALHDAGCAVLAIEPSAALLEHARAAAPGAEFRLASAYDTELVACDAILALGEVLTYHEPDANADAAVRKFFRKAGGALRRGGLLVFDIIEADGVPLDSRGWKSGSDWAVLFEALEDRATRRLCRRIETFRLENSGSYRRTSEVHQVRLFDRRAVTTWLENEGFSVDIDTAYGSFELPRRRVAFTAIRQE